MIFIFFNTQLLAQSGNKSAQLSLYFDQPEVLRKAGIRDVRCIFKDTRKLIWIGTANGLFRYDGTNTVYLRHKPADTTSIPNNNVVSIAEDHDGFIWIGTLNGVACINPNNLKSKVYRDEAKNLKGNFDNKILIGPAGEVWTGNGEGLQLFDKKNNQFNQVWKHMLEGKIVSGYVTCLTYWQKDSIVLGTFNDLVFVSTKNYGYRRFSPFDRDILVTRLYVDEAHRLWIGTWGDGCVIGNPSLGKFQNYKWEKDQRSGVDNIVNGFAETSSPAGSIVWVLGENIIASIPVNKNISELPLEKAETTTATQNTLLCMMADDENNIWAAGSVVSKFSADKNLFQSIGGKLKGAVQNIQNISLGSKNYLAISQWHGSQGLDLIDRQTGLVKTIDSVTKNDQFGSNISGIATDKYNRTWVSSLAGVYILNEHFSFIKDLTRPTNPNDALTGRKTNEILIHNDTVWIACYKRGIDLYDLNGHKLRHFEEGDGSGLKDNLFERFYVDSHSNLWICGNSYFYKYLPASEKFNNYDLSEEHSVYEPHDIGELQNGDLVIATETGLLQMNPATGNFHKVTTDLLEKEENVYSLCVDANGDVWYITATHLVNYQLKSKKFTLFGEEDGLSGPLQAVRTFDGKQLFLAEDGRIVQFSPGNWEKKIQPPRLIFHSVQVNDSSVLSAKPITALNLKYDQNKIYFEFDGISYTKPQQNTYAYQLIGIDRDWVIGNKNSASYSNLAPGNYAFHAKAANYAGVWSDEYVVNISITPPFWLTWWFIGLAIIAIGVLFFLIVRYIAQRNLRERILRLEKEQAIEKERNRIARDMHDDLGSGLTKIAILSEVAKTQLQKKDEAVMQLEKISHSSRELVDNLQDIIWVLNPKNDSLENLAAYIREYALKFFDATPLMVHFGYPAQISSYKLSEEQRRNIFMVIKETLNNIAKHADCTDVTIMLEHEGDLLEIKISDNGVGFDLSSTRNFANGLVNMKLRMEQINGTYEISSCPGKGAVTKLKIIL